MDRSLRTIPAALISLIYYNRSRFFMLLAKRTGRLSDHLPIDEWLHLFHKCRVI
jgi:hypothetical protein